jgi:hypothetical protein
VDVNKQRVSQLICGAIGVVRAVFFGTQRLAAEGESLSWIDVRAGPRGTPMQASLAIAARARIGPRIQGSLLLLRNRDFSVRREDLWRSEIRMGG